MLLLLSVLYCLSKTFNMWHSSDVRDFLQMDKYQNISDASDDEDEKVCLNPSCSCLYYIY